MIAKVLPALLLAMCGMGGLTAFPAVAGAPVRPAQVDFSQRFACDGMAFELGYRQERSLGAAEVRERRRVLPMILTVDGRPVAPDQLARAAQAFDRFPFLDHVDAFCEAPPPPPACGAQGASGCGPPGAMIWLVGLQREDWERHASGELAERPRPTIAAFRITADGPVIPEADAPMAATSGPELHTDGHGIARREETWRSYDCGTISAALRYGIERVEVPDADDFERRLTLIDMTVNGRQLTTAERAGLQERFGRFGEIEALGSNCLHDRIEIRVWGATPSELRNSVLTGVQLRIDAFVIRLSRDGLVSID